MTEEQPSRVAYRVAIAAPPGEVWLAITDPEWTRRFFHDTAQPFLIELTRDAEVRKSIYPAIQTANRKEKVRLAQVLAISGDRETLKVLELLSVDPDTEVAAEGTKAVKTLKARLG